VIDGFGTCLSATQADQAWWQELYYDDLGASILRMDLTPVFVSPYADSSYNSPWFHNNPPLPGPDGNNVRTYTNATDYTRLFAGRRAQIAVMGPNITNNANVFNFSADGPRVAGRAAQAGFSRRSKLGDFKLVGSLWSPAPWVKLSSGNSISGQSGIMPANGTPWPFIWGGNFAGGKLDTSGTARTEFDDLSQGGAGPTSALTQFARCTAAYVRGFHNAYGVRFSALSIQNECNFEEFYNSCTYPLSAGYITALKAVRAEFDQHKELRDIRLMGPEDLLGSDAYGLWQYGGGATTIHKNLQYLQNLAADPQASVALAFFCIHGYAGDGVTAAGANPTEWNWWLNGWTSSPAPGIPPNITGFAAYGKKSWMTETSGENPAWLWPASGFPGDGAWSVALRIHQALNTGQQSAWIYWQLTDGGNVSQYTLTDATLRTNSAKYVAAKHFFRFIRPGAVRVKASVAGSADLLASAYLHETNRMLVVVLLNSSSNSLTATINMSTNPPALLAFDAYMSSPASLWQKSLVAVSNLTASVTLPGFGLVTLVGASPELRARENAKNVELSWPSAAAGFQLQSAAEIQPSAVWSNVSTLPLDDGTVRRLTLPATGSHCWFRLAK
jgi:hypothetical protein